MAINSASPIRKRFRQPTSSADRSRRIPCYIALLATTTLQSPPLFADNISSTSNLPTLEVMDRTYRSTATKTMLPAQLTPQSLSITDQATLQMRDADSVNEALRYSSGVTTELRGGAVSRIDQFTIRGFANYQNSYDGLQLLFNGWNLQPQIDAIAIEQVELFKGPTSSLYGNMPPGGFVNLIAKRPSLAPYHRAGLATGTNDLREISFESRGQLANSAFSYSLVGLARERDSQAITAEDERYLLAPSLDWRIGTRTLVNFNLYYQDDPSAGIYNTVPAFGSVKNTPYGKYGTDFYAGDANWNTYEREVLMPGYKIHHDFGNGWNLLHQARYMDADAYQENTYNIGRLSDFAVAPGADRTLLRRAYLTDESSTGITVDTQLTRTIAFGGVEHNLLFGIDYFDLDSDVRYEDAATQSIDLFAPNNHLINPATLNFAASGLSSDFNIDVEQTGFYLQDQIKVGNWVLLASGRYDDYESQETGIKYGAPASSKVDQEQFSGRLGLLYAFSNGWAPYLNFAESFEPMPGSDRNGNTFEPANAEQWEVGVKYTSANNANQLTLAAFEITKENDLTRDPNGGPLDQIQTGETRSRGVELESRWLAAESLLLAFNYTWLDVEVTEDNSGLEGKTPVWVADQNASLWANYSFFDGPFAGLTLGSGVRYVGETQLDAANSDELPSYTLFDLSLRYDLGERFESLSGASISLTGNNLTDKRYYSCFDSNNCWFGAERTAEVALEIEL